MNIAITESDDGIIACYPVMHELRPHIGADDFLPRVRQQQAAGYRLASIEDDGEVVAVAGFRLGENLAWGRFLYVDDLVTLPTRRSEGHGARLLDWLRDYGRREGCAQLHLDSGLQRTDAHRFYLREGMTKASYHFSETL